MRNFDIKDDDVVCMSVQYHELQNILEIVMLSVRQNEQALEFASRHPKVFRDQEKIDELSVYKQLGEDAGYVLKKMLFMAENNDKVIYKMENEFTNFKEEGRF